MSSILVYIESLGGQLPKSSLPVISAALKAKSVLSINTVIGVLIGGQGTDEAAKLASEYGLDKILFIKSENAENYMAASYASVFAQIAKDNNSTLLMGPASSKGRDFLPRVSEILDAPQASDVIEILAGYTFKRPMYAGNLIAEVELEGDIKVLTVRTSAFPQPEKLSVSEVTEINIPVLKDENSVFVSYDTVKNERPELGEADIIVSGGRALKSKENFESVMYPLADVLGAAIGASRAAVDSGYAPNDWQVGQTGKIVAPKLYIAVGISGAVQHLAGMKDSKVIVVINKDPEAPIFEIASYGLVGDLFTVVPELIEALKAAKL